MHRSPHVQRHLCRVQRSVPGCARAGDGSVPIGTATDRGPHPGSLFLPHHLPKLIRETQNHLELRKHNVQIKMELLSLPPCTLPDHPLLLGPPTPECYIALKSHVDDVGGCALPTWVLLASEPQLPGTVPGLWLCCSHISFSWPCSQPTACLSFSAACPKLCRTSHMASTTCASCSHSSVCLPGQKEGLQGSGHLRG